MPECKRWAEMHERMDTMRLRLTRTQQTCNSRHFLLRSLFLFDLSFPFCRVSWTPTFCRNISLHCFRRCLRRESLVRSCVLSRRSATPFHCACFACATLALILTLSLSLALSRAFVCALAKHTTHTRFDSSFVLE